jgi:hypothetical protein
VTGHRPARGRVPRLAPGSAGLPLAATPTEGRGLPLRRAQGLLQRDLEAIEFATLPPILHLGAPQSRGQVVSFGPQRVALSPQRVALSDEWCEGGTEDGADAEVVGHGRIMISSTARTTFSRANDDPPVVSIAYESGLNS